MPRKNLPYVNSYKDRTGKMRYYLRRPGCRQVALIGDPGTREFLQSYASATATPKKPRRRQPKPETGFVYYLGDGQHIKIGFTSNLARRLKAYRTHSATSATLLGFHTGTVFDEKRLHRQFKKYQLRNEWFYAVPEITNHIKETTGELKAA